VKIANPQVPAFLRDPGKCRVVLLYGDDVGMIRERALALTVAVAGAPDDPFRVSELDLDDIERLPDEAASQSLMGGRRVVRVRECADTAGFAKAVKAVLDGRGEALVVMEGAGLAARSKARTMLESAPDGAAIGCYPEEARDLETTIRETLRASGVAVDPDALGWLSRNLGADRAATRAELEKLALYVGPNGRVDLDSAMACVGDLAGLSLDDALFAAVGGDVAGADRALELAMAEGAAPVQVLRAATGLLQRLHRARIEMDGAGMSAQEAVRAMRPPVFFRRAGPMARALGMWRQAGLSAALAGVAEAEKGCKRTGYPDVELCKHAISTIARRAQAAIRSIGR
jgi:DNA polymerase-3 subunit delta